MVDHRPGVDVPRRVEPRPHGLGRRKREAPDEHGETPEQSPLLLAEQPEAPVQRRPHRALPLRQVAPPGGRERPVQAREKCRRGEELRLRRRELQRQRQPRQPPAERRHVRRVLPGQAEPGRGRPRPLDEERSCGRARDLPLGGRAGRGRQRERGDGVLDLPPHPQRGSAGGQHRQARADLYQPRKLRCRRQQVLEVIQDEQEFLLPQVPGECLVRGQAVRYGRAERAEHRLGHERRVFDRGETDEGDAVGEAPGGQRGPRRFDGEAGLADPAGAGEREEPRFGLRQQARDLPELPTAPHERRRRVRQRRR